MGQREVIIETAVHLFKEKGYPVTTMQDIARELGWTKAAIYYYFKSKEEILMEIMDQVMTIAENQIEQVLTENSDPVQTLKAILKGHITAVFAEPAYMTVFFFDEHFLSAENMKVIRSRRRQYEQKISEVIRQGIDQGYLEPLEIKPVVYGILGMCNWMVQWYQQSGRLTGEEIAEIYWSLIFKGIEKSR